MTSSLLHFLNAYETDGITQLVNIYDVIAKEYDRGDGQKMYCLNYDQIKSPKTPVTNECRGAIVTLTESGWIFLCRPFDRFFNFGETQCSVTESDIDSLVLHEKIDGSLMKVWYNPFTSEWNVGSRGTAFAESEVNGWGLTFKELFERAAGFDVKGFIGCDTDKTFIFELTSHENRVVTKYEGTNIWFLGSRNNVTGETCSDLKFYEDNFDHFALIGKRVSVNSVHQIKEIFSTFTALEEGFVAYDTSGKPVAKFKSPQYVIAHRIRGEGLSKKRICELVLMNEHEEYLAVFPEDSKHFIDTIDEFTRLKCHIKNTYNAFRNAGSDKEFALAVKDFEFSACLFTARKSKIDPVEAFMSQRDSYKLDILMARVTKYESLRNSWCIR